ncbi:HD-GYP domain-containing protein [Colwelliaceae bacterium 6471]
MIVEIKIEELAIGNYVVEIVKQRGNYNLTKGGHIKNDNVIQNLAKKGVETLLIDTSKQLDVQTAPETAEQQPSTDIPTEYEIRSSTTPVILEINKARKLFKESKDIQRKVFDDALSGREINMEAVTDVTNKTIDAIFKNPDSLACIINIRKKDEYLLEHSVSVSILMTIFSRFLKIDRSLVLELSIGAFLHDVGKIMIPDEILNKPGKLTDSEFEIMKSHVNHSIEVIENTPDISKLSLEVAALHHEKLDGQGYPFQVPAENISTYGRMITICDIFDALTANRVYKDGYSHVKAFSILRNLAQKDHLDTRLVDLFIKCMGVYPVGTLVELHSNKLAIVESRNHEDPIRPKVRSFYNAQHHHYIMTQDIDLTKGDDHIIKGVRADDFDLDMNKIIEFLLMEG